MPFLLSRIISFCLLILCGVVVSTAQQNIVPVVPKYYEKAQATEREALQKKDSLLLAHAYFEYGKSYHAAGDFLRSQMYLMKALRIQVRRGESYELGRLYFWLSLNAGLQLHYQDAARNAHILYGIAQRTGSTINLMRSYKVLSDLHLRRWELNNPKRIIEPNLDSAYYYLQKFEALSHKENDLEGMAEASDQMGTLFMQRNDPRAIDYYKKALDIFTHQKKSSTGQINISLHLAEAYIKFGQWERGYNVLKKVQKIMDTSHVTIQPLMDINKVYMAYYQGIKNNKKALEHFEKLYKLEKKVLTIDREGALSRLHIEYETQKKEAQLKSQQQEIALRAENERNQRLFLTIAVALLLVAVGATVAFYRLYRKNQRISRQNEELVKEQNHRVKNNLQVVSSLLNLQARQLPDAAAKRAVTDSQLRIQSMAILHRRLYDGEELAKVNLPEFIQELVQGVLKTFGYQSVTPKFAIDAIHLHADKAVPMGLIINELVTNACKYAFPYLDNPMLEISCQQKENKLHLEVADNGPGWNEPFDGEGRVVISKKSFGMKLIKSQAEQLNATYEFAQEGGTVFRMMLKV